MRDRTLIYAWTLYQASLCPECGRPRTVCEGTAFDVETRTCGPSAAVEAWREQNPKPGPGVRVSAVPATTERVSEAIASAPRWWVAQHHPDLLDAWDQAHNTT